MFSDAVKAAQEARGSRRTYARVEADGGFATRLDEGVIPFITAQRSFFLASASADGQPYVQHRGGPQGFLKVLAPDRLAFADYRGNRQYISVGNFSENDKVQLFLIDYARRQRVKIWGRAEVVEGDSELLRRLISDGATGKAERAIVIHVTAWDANCPQHIPQMFFAADVEEALRERDERIAELERQLAPR